MKVLAVLQNQWFRDADRAREIMERHAGNPKMRRRLNAAYLFRGCYTGRVLKKVFGEERCQQIVWENASPKIGGESRSVFPADPAHLQAVLDEVQPDVVLAFGRVASDALRDLVPAEKLVVGPHPAARSADVWPTLRAMANRLNVAVDSTAKR